ncbi:MAG: hypothetical protein ACRCZ2_08345 [Fusobacteriaceae bacterium]
MGNNLEILKKIDNKENFDCWGLSELMDEYQVDETKFEDDYGWQVESIIDLNGRLFQIDYFQPYDDNGDYEFDNQPFEVEMHEEEIIVKKYKKK